jgi:hypothetical protein
MCGLSSTVQTLWDLMQAGGNEDDLYIIQIESLKTAQIFSAVPRIGGARSPRGRTEKM